MGGWRQRGAGRWPSPTGSQQRVIDHGGAKPQAKLAPENTSLVEDDRGGGSQRLWGDTGGIRVGMVATETDRRENLR